MSDVQSPATMSGSIAIDDVRNLLPSWEISLQARNIAGPTFDTYTSGVRLFTGFLLDAGMPTTLTGIKREHVEAFFAWMSELVEKQGEIRPRYRPASVKNRYDAAKQFFMWAADEGEITDSPMKNMRPPMVPEEPPYVPSEDDLRAVLKATEGKSFEDRRDRAIIRMFLDSGLRLNELAGIRWSDDPNESSIDLAERVVIVMGKGRRPREVPFGAKAAQEVDRYIRARRTRKDAYLPQLWLGTKGAMTGSGIRQMVKRRGEQAGIRGLHPHAFRHGFAHSYLAAGGQGENLMKLTGWRSRQMLQRYASTTAVERAKAEHRKLSPGDRL